MPKFTYNDIVRAKADAPSPLRRGRAWVVGVFEDRRFGPYFDKFPEGVVYTIEFEDGTSDEVHESNLEVDHPEASAAEGDQTRYG